MRARRRDFLLAGGAAAAGCSNPSHPPPRQTMVAPPPRIGDQIGSVPMGNGRNLIVIVADTFRADYLGCYGNPWIRTPNLDRFATQAVQFTECYPESLPTLPARRVILTGRRCAPLRFYPQQSDPVQAPGWHPLFYEDVTLAEWLNAAGYTTGYITDVPHVQKPGKNFHRGFDAFRFVRGNEADHYASGPAKVPLEKFSLNPEKAGRALRQYLLNRRGWRGEADTFAARTVREGIQWLRDNHEGQPFFLYLDCFDPHEPWDPPEEYAALYHRGYKGPKLITPPATTQALSKEQFQHVQALYAGEVTLADVWIGKLLDEIGRLKVHKNTLVVFLSDHGTMMGEQGQIHKGNGDRTRRQVTRVPLLIRHPDEPFAGKRINALVQHTDLMPTLLALLGIAPPARVTGENFWPLVTGERSALRNTVFTAYGYYAAARTPEWSYLLCLNPGKTGKELEELYDRRKDPEELANVAAQHGAVVRELRARVRRYLEAGEDLTNGSFAVAVET